MSWLCRTELGEREVHHLITGMSFVGLGRCELVVCAGFGLQSLSRPRLGSHTIGQPCCPHFEWCTGQGTR